MKHVGDIYEGTMVGVNQAKPSSANINKINIHLSHMAAKLYAQVINNSEPWPFRELL